MKCFGGEGKPPGGNHAGFTLVELMVTVLILGILVAIAIPQYLKSVEVAKANAAAARTSILAGAVRSYLADFPMMTGFQGNGPLNNACAAQCCYDGNNLCHNPGNTAPPNADPCQLVACGYITMHDFDCQPYLYYVGNGAGSLPCSGVSAYACAQRQTPGGGGVCQSPSAESNSTPYKGWGYYVMAAAPTNGDGCLCPNPNGGANGAPPPGIVAGGQGLYASQNNYAGCPAGCQ
jgi:prepilin-type N-terminal cleavage/methylation domain-containing protein